MITNQLPRLIAQKGISIRELSRQTGVTYSTIWALVHGRRRSVQLDVLDAVCRVLGVQPGDIYQRFGENNMQPVEEQLAKRPEPKTETRPAQPYRSDPSSEWRSW